MPSQPRPRSTRLAAVALVTAFAFTLQSCRVTQAVALKDLEFETSHQRKPTVYFLAWSGHVWQVWEVEKVENAHLEATYLGWAKEAGGPVTPAFMANFTPLEAEVAELPKVGTRELLDLARFQQARVYSPGGSLVATFFATVGWIAVALLVIAVIAAATKTSCPFVWVDDGRGGLTFLGEAYSGATGFATARDDLLPLPSIAPGSRRLALTNEADETQFTDRLELWLVEHAAGARALSTFDGRAVLAGTPVPPVRAVDLDGADVLPFVATADGRPWETDLAAAAARKPPPLREGLVLTFPAAPPGATPILELDAGNTPWLDVVFGRMAALAGDRLADVQREGDDPGNAPARWAWREREGVDLRVEVRRGDAWVKVATVPTPGPVSLRRLAVPLPTGPGELVVRISGGTGFWRVDRAALSSLLPDAPRVTRLAPVAATSDDGTDARPLLAATDARPHVLAERSARLEMRFDVPAPVQGVEQDAFLFTHGWYHVHRPPQARLDVWRGRALRDDEGALATFGLELWHDYERALIGTAEAR